MQAPTQEKTVVGLQQKPYIRHTVCFNSCQI